jgi:catechol 2,3-dioxygenase-like lactoylglutathione lyase family enzyme
MSSALQESSRSELHPAVCIGHVHLRVADLDRAMSFYRDVLGFELTAYGADFGLPGAAFLAAGDYHHHIGLNIWHSQGGTPPPEGTRDCTTSPSSIPTAVNSPGQSSAWWREAIRSVGRRTTGRRSRCISPTPTATASSSTTTARERSGEPPRPNHSILGIYWRGRAPHLSLRRRQVLGSLHTVSCIENGASKPQGSLLSESTPGDRLMHVVVLARYTGS